ISTGEAGGHHSEQGRDCPNLEANTGSFHIKTAGLSCRASAWAVKTSKPQRYRGQQLRRSKEPSFGMRGQASAHGHERCANRYKVTRVIQCRAARFELSANPPG